MDAKYLAEIRARCELGRPAQQRDVKALLAEVERLNKMLEDSFQVDLLGKLNVKDQQIATLEKALELATEEIVETIHKLDKYGIIQITNDGTSEELADYYIHQAQEQEADHAE